MSLAFLFRYTLQTSLYYYLIKLCKTCVTSQMFRKRTKVKGILFDEKSTYVENNARNKRVLYRTVGIYFLAATAGRGYYCTREQ